MTSSTDFLEPQELIEIYLSRRTFGISNILWMNANIISQRTQHMVYEEPTTANGSTLK